MLYKYANHTLKTKIGVEMIFTHKLLVDFTENYKEMASKTLIDTESKLNFK